MQPLIIIRGVSGSGKTSLAQMLLRSFPEAAHHEADHFFMDSDDNYKFDQSFLSEAHAKCLVDTKESLRFGKMVIVSNTFTEQWEMNEYIKSVNPLGGMVLIYDMPNRFRNVHGVPDEVIKRQIERMVPKELVIEGYPCIDIRPLSLASLMDAVLADQ